MVPAAPPPPGAVAAERVERRNGGAGKVVAARAAPAPESRSARRLQFAVTAPMEAEGETIAPPAIMTAAGVRPRR